MEPMQGRQGNATTSFEILRLYVGSGGRWRWRLLCATIAVVISGCAGGRPALEPLIAEPESGPPPSRAEADSVSSRVREDATRLRSLRGAAELELRAGSGAPPRRLQVSLVARRPAEARLRGRFGILATLFDFRVSADSLELYLPRDGMSVAGPRGEWISSPFPGAERLVDLLLPGPLPESAGDPGLWRRTPTGWEVSLIAPDGAGRRLTFEADALRLVRQQLLEPNGSPRPDLDVIYSRHRKAGGIWYPERIRVAATRRPERCELRFSSSVLNGDLPGALFHLDVPEGARRVPPDAVEWRLSDATEGGDE